MFFSSRLRGVMSCVSHVSEGNDSATSSNFFCSEPWREKEGGAEGHSIHLHSGRETNLTISVLSRSRVRHLGFATSQGGRAPGVRVCLSIFSQVRSLGDGPRAFAPHLTASKALRNPPDPAQAPLVRAQPLFLAPRPLRLASSPPFLLPV